MNAHTPPGAEVQPLPTVPHDGLTDAEVRAMVQELIDECVPAVRPKQTAAQAAGARAHDATPRWVVAYEDEQRRPGSVPFHRLASLRDRMQEAHRIHADELAIEAIGDVGEGRYFVTAEAGLDLHQDGVLAPLLTLPRGLPPASAREVMRAFDVGFGHGRADGIAALQADLRCLLGAAPAAIR